MSVVFCSTTIRVFPIATYSSHEEFHLNNNTLVSCRPINQLVMIIVNSHKTTKEKTGVFLLMIPHIDIDYNIDRQEGE
jgi:hypothetical protein